MKKIEQHVTSLALSKRLKELGVPQKSLFYWCNILGTKDWELRPSTEVFGIEIDLGHQYEGKEISAFLASELGEMLPNEYLDRIFKKGHQLFGYQTETEDNIYFSFEANARATMLIHLLENKLIALEEIQK